MDIIIQHKLRMALICLIFQATNAYASNDKTTRSNPLFDLPFAELMNVEITTAGKTPEKLKDIPASVYIVTRNDIEKFGYTTLTDIIENIPGVYNIYNYNGVSGNFGVRGFWNPKSQNSSIAILINGVSQLVANDNDRSNPLERINILPENIDRIEFIKGPMGVIYGNGASFGAINIITNESDKTFINASTGSRNTSKVTGRYFNEHEHGTLTVNASIYTTDGLDNKFSDMMGTQGEAVLTNSGVAIPAADATTKKLLEHQSNYFNISGTYENLYFDISNNSSRVEGFLLVPPVEDGDKRDVDVFTSRFGIKNDINDWINTDTSFTYTNYDLHRDFDGLFPGLIAENSRTYKNYEIEFLSTITPSDKLNIIAGLNSSKTDNYNEFSNAPVQGIDNELVFFDRITSSIFSQASYKFSKRLLLIAGFRVEDLLRYSRTFVDNLGDLAETTSIGRRAGIHTTSPRISAIHTFDEYNTLKLMYGKTIRYSDDRFLPEETQTYEINYLHTKDDLYASISVFNNQLDNMLTDVLFLSGGAIANQRSNSGEISTTGMEVVLKTEFLENLESELGFTIQNSTDKSSNIHVDASYSPDTLIHFKTSYTSGNTIYATQGRFVDSMLTFLNRTPADPLGTYIGNEIRNYMTWDINVRFNKVAQNMHASINIQNLFDKRIRYPNNLENTEFLAKGSIGAGRTIMGSIGWQF